EYPVGAIWLAETAASPGSPPRQFTAGNGLDTAASWSLDGRWLAFTSDRAKRGQAQLYLIAIDGGEAVRLVEERGVVSAPAWSADSTRIAYLFTPDLPEEEEKRRQDRDDAIVASQSWRRAELRIIAREGGPSTKAGPEGLHVWSFAWSPQ